MSDQPNPHQNLSEIGHLFLSSVRDRQTGGAPRPTRVPPGGKKLDVSIDLTPEEFAQMCGAPADAPIRHVPVTAVLANHLGSSQFDRVKEYARHLASRVGRVGLIELDAAELRLSSFELATEGDEASTSTDPVAIPVLGQECDLSHVADAMNELHEDVVQWLVLLPNPRSPEARQILGQIGQWLLLSTCDHDGVVACYRTLKGLTEFRPAATMDAESKANAPCLSLATIGDDDEESDRVFAKLASVCQQFLKWPIDCEPRVSAVNNFIELPLLRARSASDGSDAVTHWEIVGHFLSSIAEELHVTSETDEAELAALVSDEPLPPGESVRHIADIPMDAPRMVPSTPTGPAPAGTAPARAIAPLVGQTDPFKLVQPVADKMEVIEDVVDLTGTDASPGSLLSAIVQHEAGSLVECAVRPPMCPEARLAVDRNHGLVLLAAARTGLGDLKLIGRAYNWLIENRGLVAMALPQLSIDAHPLPRLRLIVDQSDLSADTLQPLLQSSHVMVQAYRKLRWGTKTGLLLQAA
ncbi:MAG TPA: hypothetical protein VGN72_15390 [Tepidisphaeraceae bacterium]|jgi:hypothetical protein|nr:hypothetical protein [Tepidisphaeraceae bacterium]